MILLILINFNSNSRMGLVAAPLDGTALNSLCYYIRTVFLLNCAFILFIHTSIKIVYMLFLLKFTHFQFFPHHVYAIYTVIVSHI